MKKIVIITVSLLVALIFIFHKYINMSFSTQVLPVAIKSFPIEGRWVVTRCVLTDSSAASESNTKEFWNKEAIFSGEEVYFNNESCKNPNFKIKIVDTKSYFWDSFKVRPADLGISEKKVKVVTISSGNTFFDEYIQTNDNQIIKNSNGMLLFFTRQGTEVSELPGAHEPKSSKVLMTKFQKDIVSKSGLLLGIKHKEENGYSYKTLWISSKYKNLDEIKEVKNLLVPRKNGFWEIGMDKNILWGKSLNSSNSKYKSRTLVNSEITFVGNEYISLDNKDSGLEVVAIDNLNGDNIAFSKAFGSDAGEALKKSAELFLKRLNKGNFNQTDMNYIEKNWAVIRRSGRWILRGRAESGDFDIAYATPSILTTYDDLYIPFNSIKKVVPDAVDAYASPNRDILVVVTNTNIKVFSINNKDIGKIKADIKLKDNESVVMGQWATGEYVEEWGKVVSKVSSLSASSQAPTKQLSEK